MDSIYHYEVRNYMKRVWALYRVSTTQQVDVVNDDIPMQRIACHEFAAQMGWTITGEKEEKGVSGYKVSAKKRDAIQELKEAAERHEFDILLVFMFDRLGRIESETPFVLQWFVEHGIEVWSVKEGQQKFEQHMDKLMNYLRFWQASGESEKTSIRVKTRMNQMVSEGIYTGGPVPYGYMLVDKGRLNKKGRKKMDLAVNPEEQVVILQMADLIINEGYGSHQLATWAEKKGYKTHTGSKFTSSFVLRIFRNTLLRGVISRGGVCSEPIEELRILSDYQFFKIQDILDQRNGKNEEKRQIARSNRGQALLAGIIYCAHCGCRLATSRGKIQYTRADGSQRCDTRGRYVCYHRSRGLNDCDGLSVYDSDRIDKAVMEAMRQIFSAITGCPEEARVQQIQRKAILEVQRQIKKCREQIESDERQQVSLREEIARSLTGDSVYSREDLSVALQTIRDRIDENKRTLDGLLAEEEQKQKLETMVMPAYKQFRSWVVEFEEAPLEAKKMMATQMFSRVTVDRNYVIHLEMNATYRQFCEDWIGNKLTLDGTA